MSIWAFILWVVVIMGIVEATNQIVAAIHDVHDEVKERSKTE